MRLKLELSASPGKFRQAGAKSFDRSRSIPTESQSDAAGKSFYVPAIENELE